MQVFQEDMSKVHFIFTKNWKNKIQISLPEQLDPYVEHSRLWRTRNTNMSMQLWRPGAFDKAWRPRVNFGWPKPSWFEIPGHAGEMTEFKILGISRHISVFSIILLGCFFLSVIILMMFISILSDAKCPFHHSYKKFTLLTDVFLILNLLYYYKRLTLGSSFFFLVPMSPHYNLFQESPRLLHGCCVYWTLPLCFLDWAEIFSNDVHLVHTQLQV